MKERFLYLFLLLLGATACGCGVTKTTVKSNVKVKQITQVVADTLTQKATETKIFGDTLKASNYIPLAIFDSTDTSATKPIPFVIVTESKGIEHRQSFSPVYTKGHLTAITDNDTTIAKPIQITNTREVQRSNVSTTTKRDSTGSSQTSVKKTMGFGLPSWVWYVLAGVVICIVIFFFKTYLKFL